MPADLDELEEAATAVSPEQQKEGLQVVADIFSTHDLPYGVVGGANFYLRGSGRTTDDVDVAVTGNKSLEAALDLLNDEKRVTQPRIKMSWLGGVARGNKSGVCFMKIRPLVKAKFQSHGRGKPRDYVDLLFVCKHPEYSKEVKALAGEVRLDKGELFLQEVLEAHPADAGAVRRVLGLKLEDMVDDT
ncbi:hypothetical protein N0V88_007008 [Collariella sp. IMI 366227]|nr:hypothetical protein N0V88_007008 [Collariella sp. IMI 366227]